MAGPLVIVGEAAAAGASRIASSAATRAGIQKVKDMLISLGIWEGFQAAVNNAPDALSKMYNSMVDSGADPEDAQSTKDGGRSIILVEAARQGIVLDESAGLSRTEAKKYSSMLKQFGKALSVANDKQQVARPSTDNDPIAQASFILNMAEVCNRLGLSGPNRFRQLYNIALMMNTITEVDVEKAELHERMFGIVRL